MSDLLVKSKSYVTFTVGDKYANAHIGCFPHSKWEVNDIECTDKVKLYSKNKDVTLVISRAEFEKNFEYVEKKDK